MKYPEATDGEILSPLHQTWVRCTNDWASKLRLGSNKKILRRMPSIEACKAKSVDSIADKLSLELECSHWCKSVVT